MKTLSLSFALLLGTAASAQETLTYSDGNPIFDASITLATPLPANGTTDASPVAFTFTPVSGVQLEGTLVYEPGFEPVTTPLYQFTTLNGAITTFDVSLNMTEPGTNSPTNLMFTISSNGDSYFEQQSGAACEFNPCLAMTATSAPGKWNVPEIDSSGAAAALTLLCGVLILKGRQRT
jgi:hypothetical protein